MIEEELKSYLENDVALSALIGNRIYPIKLPEKPDYPALTFFLVSGQGHHDIDVDFPRFQFSAWSNRYLEAKKVAIQARNALNRYKGSMGDIEVIQGVFMGERDFFEEKTKLYQVPVDIKIIYRR